MLPTICTCAEPVAVGAAFSRNEAGSFVCTIGLALNVCVLEEPPQANPDTIAASTAIRRILFSPSGRQKTPFPEAPCAGSQVAPGSLPQTDRPFQCRRSGWA